MPQKIALTPTPGKKNNNNGSSLKLCEQGSALHEKSHPVVKRGPFP